MLGCPQEIDMISQYSVVIIFDLWYRCWGFNYNILYCSFHIFGGEIEMESCLMKTRHENIAVWCSFTCFFFIYLHVLLILQDYFVTESMSKRC